MQRHPWTVRPASRFVLNVKNYLKKKRNKYNKNRNKHVDTDCQCMGGKKPHYFNLLFILIMQSGARTRLLLITSVIKSATAMQRLREVLDQ